MCLIINMYDTDNRASKHRKQKLTELKREIVNSIIIARGFQNPSLNTR